MATSVEKNENSQHVGVEESPLAAGRIQSNFETTSRESFNRVEPQDNQYSQAAQGFAQIAGSIKS